MHCTVSVDKCCSGVVTPGVIASNDCDCGCEPSAQRPVVTSGAGPSLHTSCSVAGEGVTVVVALTDCGWG